MKPLNLPELVVEAAESHKRLLETVALFSLATTPLKTALAIRASTAIIVKAHEVQAGLQEAVAEILRTR